MTTANKIVAIYARYSSDLQNDNSIDDQVRECKRALKKNEKLVHTFSDRAKSGSFMETRPGLKSLLSVIEAEQIDVVLTESLDRLSRDISDAAQIFRLTKFHNVKIREVNGGWVDEMKVGFKGTMNGVFLTDFKQRTRRGQIGKIRNGQAAGGLPYGYHVKYLNDEGLPERGLREIHEGQAKIVRTIFRKYTEGASIAEIVRHLNSKNIPAPRGGKWSSTTISGHLDRGDGILQNALYRGVLVWGRCPEVKHPSTSKRQIRVADQPDGEQQNAAAGTARSIQDAAGQYVSPCRLAR